ncbi:hypothetical protein ACI7RC_17120 [Brevibacillus sp. B_LB10_24]|uniref:hypothetical protein n=1 Tax=Brevibacillus sp. B_LB10_24 TaxID=3380645 RepID=UPI0038B9DA9D
MRRKAGTLLMAIGMFVVAIAIFQYFEHQIKMKQALAKAEALVASSPMEDTFAAELTASSAASSDSLSERPEFSPSENEVIGTLLIPKIKAELPIIEGTDKEMLKQGVGHYLTSAFPSEGEQDRIVRTSRYGFSGFCQAEVRGPVHRQDAVRYIRIS